MFKKVKKIFSNIKIIIICLIVLLVVEFGLVVYLTVKINILKKEFAEIGPREKLEKIHSYAVVLEKFEEFKTKEGAENTTAELEKAVLAAGSGVLENLFEEILLGENLEEDMEYFLEAVIDSLKFFSK